MVSLKIDLKKRHIWFFSAVLTFLAISLVIAYGGGPPNIIGHTGGEIDQLSLQLGSNPPEPGYTLQAVLNAIGSIVGNNQIRIGNLESSARINKVSQSMHWGPITADIVKITSSRISPIHIALRNDVSTTNAVDAIHFEFLNPGTNPGFCPSGTTPECRSTNNFVCGCNPSGLTTNFPTCAPGTPGNTWIRFTVEPFTLKSVDTHGIRQIRVTGCNGDTGFTNITQEVEIKYFPYAVMVLDASGTNRSIGL